MGKQEKLQVDHGPVPEDITLNEADKAWLRMWNRHDEIPGEEAPGSAEEDGEDGGDAAEYSDYTVDELKDKLRERELPVSGSKEELVARLEEDDESSED